MFIIEIYRVIYVITLRSVISTIMVSIKIFASRPRQRLTFIKFRRMCDENPGRERKRKEPSRLSLSRNGARCTERRRIHIYIFLN